MRTLVSILFDKILTNSFFQLPYNPNIFVILYPSKHQMGNLIMRKTFYILLFTLVFVSVSAQTSKEADDLFNAKQFEQALIAYKTLLTRNPQSVLYQYRYARCNFELGNQAEAAKYFEQAGERYPLRNFYLGELYYADYRFSEAAEAYQKFLSALEATDERITYLNKRIEKCEQGARLLNRVEDIAIVDSLLINKDNFLDAYRLSAETGTLQLTHRMANNQILEAVTFSNQRNDRKYYSDLNNDNLDIYTTYKLLDKWTKPELLPSSVNTKANESFPFVLSDGVTMYFASDGEESLGGYDIFITRYNANTNSYLASENIGMPFNSIANDYMMVIDEVQNMGWFVTDRNAPEGKVVMYVFEPNVEKQIIRNADETYIRNAAQLKTYKRAIKQIEEIPIETAKNEQSASDFVFVITEGIVYGHISDFHNKEAAQAFQASIQAGNQLEDKRSQLQKYRYQYATAKTTAEKQRLTPAILNVERTVSELETKVEKQELQARRLELDFLNNRQK